MLGVRKINMTHLAVSASAGEQEVSKTLILMGLSAQGVDSAFSMLGGTAGAGVFLKKLCNHLRFSEPA